MNKEETIKTLCSMVSEVGSEVFKDQCTHDCFCKLQSFEDDDVHVDDEVIQYIIDEVRKAAMLRRPVYGMVCCTAHNHNAEPGVWSAVPPIVNGFWWYKDDELKYPVILRLLKGVFTGNEFAMGRSANYFLTRPGARWFTEPLMPPEDAK